MPYNKTTELLKAIGDLYNVNNIVDFNKLTVEQRIYALLWCIYTNNYTSLSSNSLKDLKNSLTDLQIKLKDKIVIENIDSLSIDLHELDTVASINSIINKLTTLTNKDYTTNFNEVITKLNALTPINNTTELNNISNLLTTLNTLINDLNNDLVVNDYLVNTTSLDYLADKITNAIVTKLDDVHAEIHTVAITYSTTLINSGSTATTLSTPARDVGSANLASYLVVVTNISTNNLPTKVEGSIDGINWTTVPLRYSNLSGNSNHIYTIPSNGTYLFSTEVLTKYVRLTVSNIVTARVTGQLFVK